MTTLSQSEHLDHVHPPFGVEQVGWLGQTGRVYRLDEDPSQTESGSFSPLYQPRDESCGHSMRAERLEDVLHSREQHPDFTYTTTQTEARPEGEGWEPNTSTTFPEGRLEGTYDVEWLWRRRKL